MGSNLGMTDFDTYIKGIETCDALVWTPSRRATSLVYHRTDRTRILKPRTWTVLSPPGRRRDCHHPGAQIALKEGKAGELLSMGVKRMSEKIGKDSPSTPST